MWAGKDLMVKPVDGGLNNENWYVRDEMSREFFISRTKLTRDFRAALGMSVSDYITAVRINRSKIFLDENRSVAETALLCGFSSSSHYIGVFAKLTGRTPAEFRKRQR